MASTSPTGVLFQLAAQGDWLAVLSRCESHPQDAAYCRSDGYTPLHVALERRPPLPAIEAMLKVCPDAAARGAHVIGHGCGYTYWPLHTACAAGEPLDILRALGRAHPDAARQRGGGLMYQNLFPMEYLWGHYFGLPISVSGTIGWKGSGWSHRPPNCKRLYAHIATVAATQSLEQYGEFWIQTCFLLDIASRGRRGAEVPLLEANDDLLVIRAASAIGLFLEEDDGMDAHAVVEDVPELLRDMVRRMLCRIQQSLRQWQKQRPKMGYLLHRAIQDELPWSTIYQLYMAAPDMLSVRDCQTGLFPFMLAAAASNGDDYLSDQYSLECLNKTFQLLVTNPALVLQS